MRQPELYNILHLIVKDKNKRSPGRASLLKNLTQWYRKASSEELFQATVNKTVINKMIANDR